MSRGEGVEALRALSLEQRAKRRGDLLFGSTRTVAEVQASRKKKGKAKRQRARELGLVLTEDKILVRPQRLPLDDWEDPYDYEEDVPEPEFGIFVYGTLRTGERLNSMLPHAKREWGKVLGHLHYVSGSNGPYPVLLASGTSACTDLNSFVVGEFVHVSHDEIAEVISMELGAGYTLRQVPMYEITERSYKVVRQVWVFNYERPPRGARIWNGDWVNRDLDGLDLAWIGEGKHVHFVRGDDDRTLCGRKWDSGRAFSSYRLLPGDLCLKCKRSIGRA